MLTVSGFNRLKMTVAGRGEGVAITCDSLSKSSCRRDACAFMTSRSCEISSTPHGTDDRPCAGIRVIWQLPRAILISEPPSRRARPALAWLNCNSAVCTET